jgi:hypothetical protein
MKRALFVALALALLAAPASAAGLSGKYIEARTCDIWTGPCFANADMNLAGKNAIMAWMVEKGSHDGVKLDGLGVVAVIAASDTLGCEQTGKAKAVLIVDQKATKEQQKALVALAKKQGGKLIRNVVKVTAAKVELSFCPCEKDGCGLLKAGDAKISTRCIGDHDKVCGNESAFYPPLVKNVTVKPALAVENSYKGKGVGGKWDDAGRRGAYLGTFATR